MTAYAACMHKTTPADSCQRFKRVNTECLQHVASALLGPLCPPFPIDPEILKGALNYVNRWRMSDQRNLDSLQLERCNICVVRQLVSL